MLGEYRVRNSELMKLFLKVQKLQEKFKKIRYLHVSRWNKFQRIADEILNQELDKRGFRKKFKFKR